MLHSPGERMHQRTTSPNQWGSICLTPLSLEVLTKTVGGRLIAPPSFGRIYSPPPADRRQLLRLHAQAGRIAETDLTRIAHKEIARALEQELIHALVTCLANGRARVHRGGEQRRMGSVVILLEAALTASRDPEPTVSAMCDAIGISERRLRSCCRAVLGLHLEHFLQLRRLERLRKALLHPSGTAESPADAIRRYGFADFSTFTTAYQAAFGSLPYMGAKLDIEQDS
jgi:AraC-like DNA-binding protein